MKIPLPNATARHIIAAVASNLAAAALAHLVNRARQQAEADKLKAAAAAMVARELDPAIGQLAVQLRGKKSDDTDKAGA